jgi:8-oxo-dGTP diphosphatase
LSAQIQPSSSSSTAALPELPVTVDTVIFTVLADALQVLLVKRGEERFAGLWSLPGGFVRLEERLETAALRELEEATGAVDVYLEQLYTFGDPSRDTRGRVISVAYVALLDADRCPLKPHDLEAEARWWPVEALPPLAFDHGEMIDVALERVQTKLQYTTIASQLAGESFTLSQLQSLYERVLGRELDKRNFRRKLKLAGLVEPTGASESEGPGRPAELYRFRQLDFFQLREKGIHAPF